MKRDVGKKKNEMMKNFTSAKKVITAIRKEVYREKKLEVASLNKAIADIEALLVTIKANVADIGQLLQTA